MKYEFIIQKLEKHGFIDENHGILTINQIKDICADVFQDIDIDYCYLFDSSRFIARVWKIKLAILSSVAINGYKNLLHKLKSKKCKFYSFLCQEKCKFRSINHINAVIMLEKGVLVWNVRYIPISSNGKTAIAGSH